MKKFTDVSSNFVNVTSTNADAIKNSIRNLVLIRKHEFPGMHELGSKLTSLLFREPDVQVRSLISEEIRGILEYYETRITVSKVHVKSNDQNQLLVDVIYKVNESFVDEEQSVRIRLR